MLVSGYIPRPPLSIWRPVKEFEGLWHFSSLSLLQTKWVRQNCKMPASCSVRALLAQELGRGWS